MEVDRHLEVEASIKLHWSPEKIALASKEDIITALKNVKNLKTPKEEIVHFQTSKPCHTQTNTTILTSNTPAAIVIPTIEILQTKLNNKLDLLNKNTWSNEDKLLLSQSIQTTRFQLKNLLQISLNQKKMLLEVLEQDEIQNLQVTIQDLNEQILKVQSA